MYYLYTTLPIDMLEQWACIRHPSVGKYSLYKVGTYLARQLYAQCPTIWIPGESRGTHIGIPN